MYIYTHGGDVFSPGHENVLDFSANINPFGLPPGVKKAMVEALEGCGIYPDPFSRELRAALAEREGAPASSIFCGAGAADILWRLAAGLRPARALVAAPSFGGYEEALGHIGCAIEYFLMREDEDFCLTQRFLHRLEGDTGQGRPDMVFLCNPNNPTGQVIGKGLLEGILAACARAGIVIVVDECFIDFLPDAEERTVKGDVARYENLIVLKAFTKRFAMAGVRLGYCLCANEGILEGLYRGGQPWGVSGIAQRAGIAALKERAYAADSLAMIDAERQRAQQALVAMGYKVYDSRANFVFFRESVAQGDLVAQEDLKEVLLRENILIRSCENYRGLSRGYYRAAVRKPEENDRLLTCLAKRSGRRHG